MDCLLIGYNEVDFENYKFLIDQMTVNSVANRNLSKEYIKKDGEFYLINEIFNRISEEKGIDVKLKPSYFNNTLGYLCTYLKKNNVKMDYLVSFQDEKDKLDAILLKNSTKVIAITTTLYTSTFPIVEIVEYIRERNSNVKIILGGPYIYNYFINSDTERLNYILELLNADFYVFSNQGEAALVNLINQIKNNTNTFKSILNIAYKENSTYRINKFEKESNSLDEYPIDWYQFKNSVEDFVSIRTSISCVFSCQFCGYPIRQGKYQRMGDSYIKEELSSIKKIDSVKCIHFVDDTFNISKNRLKYILKVIINDLPDIKWCSYIRSHLLDEEIVALMKQSNCVGVFLGLESGSDFILSNMNKKTTAQENFEGINLLAQYEILTLGSFIIGFPGENYNTVKETEKFINESKLDFYRVQPWFYEHFTPIYSQKDLYNLQGEGFEWQHNTMNCTTACDLLDELIINIDNSLFVPQYNFDIDSISRLICSGWSINEIRDKLKIYNSGLKHKLVNNAEEISGNRYMNLLTS